VLWRASGDLTAEKRASLLAAVATLSPAGVHPAAPSSGN
jgi:hypothetical protein